MAKRKIFGKRDFAVDDEIWHVELRADGLHVHHKHSKTAWHFPPRELAMICHKQYALPFIYELEPSHKTKPMPRVPEEQLVPDAAGSNPLHASEGPETGLAQERGDGLDSQGTDGHFLPGDETAIEGGLRREKH